MSDMLKSRMEMQELAKQYDIRPVPPKPAELPGAAVQVCVCLDGGGGDRGSGRLQRSAHCHCRFASLVLTCVPTFSVFDFPLGSNNR